MRKTAFRENVTIITGASFGIGRELALQLADQGAWLALAARNAEKLAEVSTQCNQRKVGLSLYLQMLPINQTASP